MTVEARKSQENAKATLHFALEEYLRNRPDKKTDAKPVVRQPPRAAARSRRPPSAN